MSALATVKGNNLDHLSQRLSALTDPMVAKAEKLLGQEIRELTKRSKIYAKSDMLAVIDAIDKAARTASSDEATSLAAILIGKCRAHGLANGPIDGMDFKLYAVGISEAFLKFPASVGLQAVDGGSGLPAKSKFWPKPFDVVAFCDEIMLKRGRAKAMARRHMDEAQRRSEEPKWVEPTPEQKARVQAMADNLRRTIAANAFDKAGF